MTYKDTPLYKKGYNFANGNNNLLSLPTVYGIANIILTSIPDLSSYSTDFKEAYNNLQSLISKQSKNTIDIFADILYILSSLTNNDGFNILQKISTSYSNVFETLNATILTSLSAMSVNNIGTYTPYILYGGDRNSNIAYNFDSAYSSRMNVITFEVITNQPVINNDTQNWATKMSFISKGKVTTYNLDQNGQLSESTPNIVGTMPYNISNDGNKITIYVTGTTNNIGGIGPITITPLRGPLIQGNIVSTSNSESTGLVQAALSYNSKNPLNQKAYSNQGIISDKLLNTSNASSIMATALGESSVVVKDISTVQTVISAANSNSAVVDKSNVNAINSAIAQGNLTPDNLQNNMSSVTLSGVATNSDLAVSATLNGKTVIKTPELSYSDIDGVIEDFISELSKMGKDSIYVNVQNFKNQSYTFSVELNGPNNILLFKFTINSINNDINNNYEATITLDGNNSMIANFYDIIYKSLSTYNFIPTSETPENYHYYSLSSFTGDPNNSSFTLNMKVSENIV